MPTSVASLLYLSFVAFLFWRDIRQKPNVTTALWLPVSWVLVSGTRFISAWMGMFGLNIGGSSVEEGSPVDALYFFAVIVLGLRVLAQRRVQLSEFVRYNRWVTLYLLLCLVSLVWSDFPLVAFKRWTKLLGQPIMVLIVLTEPDPREAMVRLFKRCAYVILPVSILFIKYFPEWGRGFDQWSGAAVNCGITTSKNLLGLDCMILGYFFIWHLMSVWKLPKGRERRDELILAVVLLAMIFWLLNMAHSSTSLGCILVATAVTLMLGFKFVKKELVNFYMVGVIIFLVVAEFGFHASALAIEVLGRDATLTGRTEIWDMLLHWDVNPVVGTGFESFWLGERREKIWDIFPVLQLNSAHNGYLETYINLGLVGLLFTLGMVLATYFKSARDLVRDFHFGRFRLSYLIIFLIYNWTEVGFRTHTVQFFVFFLVAIDYPWATTAAANSPSPRNWSGADDYEF
jgi:O-antigen ligase